MLKIVSTTVGIVAMFSAFIGFIWWAFYALWNSIAAGIFGAPELTFWQAVGVLVLVGMLTGGFRAAASKS